MAPASRLGSAIACSYTCGRSDSYSSGTTTGRFTYSGSYRSILNEIGRPEIRDSLTLSQSSSVVFSTMAQPCRNGRFSSASDQAIAGLPDRRLDDVADADPPVALAVELQLHGLLL